MFCLSKKLKIINKLACYSFAYKNYGNLNESKLNESDFKESGNKIYNMIKYYRRYAHLTVSWDPLNLV
jgi:hypothetical protein